MGRYAFLISYDGTSFSGWQKQPHNATVQGEIEKVVATIFQQSISVVGASRTDSGVHALYQVAHCDLPCEIEEESILHSLNGLLPPTISVHKVISVPSSFHARYSPYRKTYHYYLDQRPVQDPFMKRRSYHIKKELDIELMQRAISYFLGRHDFTAFANESHLGAAKNRPIKTISHFAITPTSFGYLISITADGFLYKMVRNIIGTLLSIDKKKIALCDIPTLFSKKDRKLLPAPAPAKGLFLMDIKYPTNLFQGFHPGQESIVPLHLSLSLKEDNEEDRPIQALLASSKEL